MKYIKLILFIMCIMLCGCSHTDKSKIGFSSEEVCGRYYESVINDLIELGFNNIKTLPMYDLHDDSEKIIKGKITSFKIDGDSKFTKDKKYELGSEIVVEFRTYVKESLNIDSKYVQGKSHCKIKQYLLRPQSPLKAQYDGP